MDFETEWVENWIYPGTHWKLYGKNGDYIGRIDKNPCYGDRYRWEAYPFSEKRRVYGYAETLEDAMKAVNQIVNNQAFQLSLPLR